MQRRVFFSWQSDTVPNSHYRGLIGDALNKVAKTIKKDDSITIDLIIDRDTSGVPGAPDISETIFRKIDAASVFVADVSFINAGAEGRLTPNPNVLVELGYAIKTLGWSNVLLVLNTVTGKPEQLPFDLRGKRVVPYTCEADDQPAAARKELEGRLEAELRLIFTRLDKSEVDDTVLRLAGEQVRQETHEFSSNDIGYIRLTIEGLAEKAAPHGLSSEQVKDALEVLETRGLLKLANRFPQHGYYITPEGFDRYAQRNVERYSQLLADTGYQLVVNGVSNGAELIKALGQSPLLVEHALELLRGRGKITIAKAMSGRDRPLFGWDISKVTAEFKREVLGDSV